MDPGPGGASARGEVHDPGPPPLLGVPARNVAEPLQTLQQLIHGLLAHPRPLGQFARPATVGPRVLQYRHVRQTQITETGTSQSGDDAAMNGLSRQP